MRLKMKRKNSLFKAILGFQALVVVSSLFIVLAGCAVRGSIQDASTITANTGLLVVKLNSTIKAKLQIQIVNYKDQSMRSDHVKEYFTGPVKGILIKALSSQYWVMEMPPGEFMWGEVWVYLSGGEYHARLHDQSRFTIESGKINYVGDVTIISESPNIRVSKYIGIEMRNMEEAAKRFMQTRYPAFASKYPFVNKAGGF